jgi:uncharacterized protein (TIGR00297 family)
MWLWLLITIPLLSPLLEAKLLFSVIAIIFVIYSSTEGRKSFVNVDKKDSVFSVLIAALLLSSSSFANVPAYIYSSSFAALPFAKLSRNGIERLTFTSLAVLGYLVYFTYLSPFTLTPPTILFLSVVAGLTISLIYSVNSPDRNLASVIGVASVLMIFHVYSPSVTFSDLAIAFSSAFILSFLAVRSGVADESGLMSATLVGMLIILFTDIRYYAVLLTFYIVGSAATKYKYQYKLSIGEAEPAGGARGYANVFGNSLPALFFAMNYGFYGLDVMKAAFIASVASALADTMASEIGKTSQKAYLIINLKPVKPGVSGGVSVLGEMAALAGAILTTLSAMLLGIIDESLMWVIVLSAFAGVHVDSILGATLEKKGYLTNSLVNLLGNFSAGLFCYLLLT